MQKIRIPSEVLARLEARGRPTPPDLARCTVAQALAVFIEVEALRCSTVANHAIAIMSATQHGVL